MFRRCARFWGRMEDSGSLSVMGGMEVKRAGRHLGKRKETNIFGGEKSWNPMNGRITKKIKRDGVAHIHPNETDKRNVIAHIKQLQASLK